MPSVLEYIVEDCAQETRIDKYLTIKLNQYTRSTIQSLIKDNHVRVNGEIIKANYKLKYDDQIQVTIPQPEDTALVPEDIPLHIVYEDGDIIIVNKDQGMVVHPAPGNYTGTLVNALLHYAKGNLSTINGEVRPGIVHRIDKDTSGILMVAKNNIAHEKLAAMLKEHDITRKYHAIVFGNFKEDEGMIDEPIGRHPIDRKRMAVTDKNSRNALTTYKVLQQFKGFSHIEVTLSTGRTHQIRVHMKHIGHPVLGDPVYGPKKQPYNLRGQLLHAKILGFNHPTTGEYMLFDSSLPLYFTQMIDKLSKK